LNRKSSSPRLSHDRWLVSYADFITLLFAFFVVLYAFAKADEKKHAEVSDAIASAFRTLSIAPSEPGTAPALPGFGQRSSRQPEIETRPESVEAQLFANAAIQTDLEQIRRDLHQRLAIQIANRTISIELGRDGLIISLREAGFFSSGSALPKPETTPVLNQIAQALRNTPYDVRIEGHTDDVPVHNPMFDSNWELSSARAVVITRMFLQLHTVAPERLSAIAFSQYRPVADNRSAETRAENRRVDIVIMPRAVLKLSAPDETEKRKGWRKITDP
jgi:chemotaxis protein MotB